MRPLTSLALSLLYVVSFSDARVDFTFSTLFNIYDFEGVKEVPLARCSNGCHVYASTNPNHLPGQEGPEPYMENLVIYDPANNRNVSIADLGLKWKPGGWQKMPLELSAPGPHSLLNLNAPDDKGSDVTMWVVDLAKANQLDYEIYDAATMTRAVSPPASIITVMSAVPFRVMAEPGEANSYTTRLVGFDNALENNPDLCRVAYQTSRTSKFDGFEFQVNAPLFSILFNEKNPVNLKADYTYLNVRDLSKSGFLSSAGNNGCDRLGGNQVHRSKSYQYSEDYDYHGEPNDYQVYFDADLDITNEIRIKDMTNSHTSPISGPRAHLTMTIPSTQYMIITYNDIAPPQSFILRYTSKQMEKEMTSIGPLTSSTSASSTTSTSTVTTSAAKERLAFAATVIVIMPILTTI